LIFGSSHFVLMLYLHSFNFLFSQLSLRISLTHIIILIIFLWQLNPHILTHHYRILRLKIVALWLLMWATNASSFYLRHGQLEKCWVFLHLHVEELQFLAGLLKAFYKVLLGDFAYVNGITSFDDDFVQFAAKMLDTGLEVQKHFLDLVVGFSSLLILLLGLGKISLHVVYLLPSHCLETFKFHLLKIIFDSLSLISKVHQLLLILCLDISKVLISITLSSKLL